MDGDHFLSIRKWLEETKVSGIKLGFDNCVTLLERLENPHLDFPSIHVAGTNGKGSLCAQISALARAIASLNAGSKSLSEILENGGV